MLRSEVEPSRFLSQMEPIAEPAAACHSLLTWAPDGDAAIETVPRASHWEEHHVTAEAWDRCHQGVASCVQATAAWLPGTWAERDLPVL